MASTVQRAGYTVVKRRSRSKSLLSLQSSGAAIQQINKTTNGYIIIYFIYIYCVCVCNEGKEPSTNIKIIITG